MKKFIRLVIAAGLLGCAAPFLSTSVAAAEKAAPKGSIRPEGKLKSAELVALITFVREPSLAGQVGGVMHFGFRLQAPGDIDHAVQEVERAGGRILRRGEFGPGLPFVYVSDPDGYEVEIWYE